MRRRWTIRVTAGWATLGALLVGAQRVAGDVGWNDAAVFAVDAICDPVPSSSGIGWGQTPALSVDASRVEPSLSFSQSAAVTVYAGGDSDADFDVDLADFADFQKCFAGPGVPVGPECACSDIEGDTDVDTTDFDLLAVILAGPG